MALITVTTNLPDEKFSSAEAAEGIVSKISEKFDIKPGHIALTFICNARMFYRASADPMVVIKVVAAPPRVTDASVASAVKLLTERVQETFPDMPAERILVFVAGHDPSRAGVNGQTMAEFIGANPT